MNTERLSVRAGNKLAVLLLAICLGTAVHAQEPEEQPEAEPGNESRTDLDHSLSLAIAQRYGQDDDEPDRDTGLLEAELTMELQHRFSKTLRANAELELSALYLSESALREQSDYEEVSYEFDTLYVQQRLYDKAFRWRLGRQHVDGLLNQTVDANLDGLRLTLERDRHQLDFSFTREDWLRASTDPSDDEIYNALLQYAFSPTKSSDWLLYALHRDEQAASTNDESSTVGWYGLQSVVELAQTWRYFLSLEFRDGEETDDNETETLGGSAASLGISWHQRGRFKPVFSLGFAQATEDYRQSGLHSNEFDRNDRNDFRYFGEALDPELANMQILTLSAGARIARQWRGDISLHTYQQVEADDRIRGSDLEFDPQGDDKDLGTGADLILEYRHTKNLELQFTYGLFEPGEAFESTRDTVFVWQLEMEFEF
ncbi:MAG: alginate export family protein [Granulosicoccus sp.]